MTRARELCATGCGPSTSPGGRQPQSYFIGRPPLKISFGDEHVYQKSAGAGQVTWLSVLAHPGK